MDEAAKIDFICFDAHKRWLLAKLLKGWGQNKSKKERWWWRKRGVDGEEAGRCLYKTIVNNLVKTLGLKIKKYPSHVHAKS